MGRELLDRGFGKPAMAVDIDIEVVLEKKLLELSPAAAPGRDAAINLSAINRIRRIWPLLQPNDGTAEVWDEQVIVFCRARTGFKEPVADPAEREKPRVETFVPQDSSSFVLPPRIEPVALPPAFAPRAEAEQLRGLV